MSFLCLGVSALGLLHFPFAYSLYPLSWSLPLIIPGHIWGSTGNHMDILNVVPVTAKLLYILLVLCFLHHERHYHYCWCSILFWSLDSGLYLIKSKIYDTVQSATSTSPSAHIVVAPIKPHKCTVSSRHYASTPISWSHGAFINLLVKPHMNFLCRVDSKQLKAAQKKSGFAARIMIEGCHFD